VAPVDRPWAVVPLGPSVSNEADLLSMKVSTRYLVLPAEDGGILVVNRLTGVTTTLTGAGLDAGTRVASLNGAVLCLIRHRTSGNDSVIFLDLAANRIGS
jgi:hypothetical protein